MLEKVHDVDLADPRRFLKNSLAAQEPVSIDLAKFVSALEGSDRSQFSTPPVVPLAGNVIEVNHRNSEVKGSALP